MQKSLALKKKTKKKRKKRSKKEIIIKIKKEHKKNPAPPKINKQPTNIVLLDFEIQCIK